MGHRIDYCYGKLLQVCGITPCSQYTDLTMLSPLASNLYLPAIPEIGRAFNKSTELINLTVTVYVVLQGIGVYSISSAFNLLDMHCVAPLFWGTLADTSGRRLALIGTMVTLAGSSVGLALVPTSAYWALLLLRSVTQMLNFSLRTEIFTDVFRLRVLQAPMHLVFHQSTL